MRVSAVPMLRLGDKSQMCLIFKYILQDLSIGAVEQIKLNIRVFFLELEQQIGKQQPEQPRRPSSVSVLPFDVRSKSLHPSSVSRFCIHLPSACCEIYIDSAAFDIDLK